MGNFIGKTLTIEIRALCVSEIDERLRDTPTSERDAIDSLLDARNRAPKVPQPWTMLQDCRPREHEAAHA